MENKESVGKAGFQVSIETWRRWLEKNKHARYMSIGMDNKYLFPQDFILEIMYVVR